MNPSSFLHTPFRIHLSFHRIIDQLQKKASDPSDISSLASRQLLDEIEQHPELGGGITDTTQIESHAPLIRRLLADYFPEDLSRNEIKTAGIPFQNYFFNHSRRFRDIMQAAGPSFEFAVRDFDEHQVYIMSCCIILNAFYATQVDFAKPLFYDIPDAAGIMRHYRVLYNADFLDIEPTEKSVKLTPEDIDQLINNYSDLALWKEKFPKDSWILKGFAILTLIDVTVENAVSTLKEKLLGLKSERFKESIESVFHSIYRIPDIRIGFTLFNSEDGKFRTGAFGEEVQSLVLPDETEYEDNQTLLEECYQCLINEKTYFVVSDTAKHRPDDAKSQIVSRLHTKNIRSFILAPVVKNDVIIGVLEVVSPRAKELNSVNANKLDVVMPFLTDTIERIIAGFQNQVRAVIQKNYTTIHPSVYWRFEAEANDYIEATQHGGDYVLKEVVFADVYPLYGQIDIKGSSEIRNESMQKDLQRQLETLSGILVQLNDHDGAASFSQEIEQVNSFSDQLEKAFQTNLEPFISSWLHDHVHNRLKQISNPRWLHVIDSYFTELDKNRGSFFTYRRKYDTTVSLINKKMTHIMDARQVEAQAEFPHYFERFKTDGVEHNIYAGSSISPNRQFSEKHLRHLRLWQLKTLCQMENAHHRLKHDLPYALDVTTLVLVSHSPISIRFRMDEKRFDVDGTYNARFEMIKKRIDKAHVKFTDERIAEAGKLTIVYSNQLEEQEYLEYSAQLQAEHVLGGEIERLEIEDLQGVAGLKALRLKFVH